VITLIKQKGKVLGLTGLRDHGKDINVLGINSELFELSS